MVTVKADDGTCSDARDVTVTVTNGDEEGMVPLSSQEPPGGTELTGSLTDADGGITGETRRWATSDARSDGMDGTFTDIATATSMTYTPVYPDDACKYLWAMAMYDDGDGSARPRWWFPTTR